MPWLSRLAPLLLGGLLLPATSRTADTFYVLADPHAPYSAMNDLTRQIFGQRQPLTFRMSMSYPTPFNPASTITWTQPDWTSARLSIISLTGEKVQDIPFGLRGPGVYSYTWIQLWDGVYSYTLTLDEESLERMAGC